MCFSAPVSFAASGGLVLLGGATYLAASKKDKILVAIPLLFGVQQAFEGVQWLYLNKGSTSPVAGYGFLFFALMVWPVYVPAFVFTLDKKHRKILGWFVLAGTAVALYFLGLMLTQTLSIRVLSKSVRYSLNFRHQWLVTPAYLLAIFGSLFVSSRPIFRWFGLAISILALIAWKLYAMEFVSVWCFFAAIVSSMFFVYVQYQRFARARE